MIRMWFSWKYKHSFETTSKHDMPHGELQTDTALSGHGALYLSPYM